MPFTLSWGKFGLQFLTVLAAFALASAVPILLLGQSGLGLALSAFGSMGGALLAAWLWLRREGAVAAAFDLSEPASWSRTLAAGLVATFAILAILIGGGRLMDALGLGAPNTLDVMTIIRESPWMLLLWISLVAWGAAAFGEELLWRGFLIDRLSRLKGLAGRPPAIIAVQAAIFALPHAYQGLGGVVVTGAVGLYLGWLRMRMNGNLWALIFAHGLVDTTMLTAGYFDAFALVAEAFER
ncbi:CPBP family intramembrane glutamic endopeptidase [Aurantiacibacter odishensis]|uniref:CPBP family intramembrane glutamic endopeptidase n=1 Tax=Aurantiacibacter odishensis TaxID=1155476 RepID=UPI0013C49DFA|nr:CPBP family intramembrane glutamic endopeptidase [Aurantiacibacter odishensis]